ncbi:MAG: aminotransferase class V-fold PLP-dependent enzyme [Bacteriovoracaceae bacterium]|nr:aminotransferase class V-fold PLP-dependent enzyme [Bacteriovoracaceae bacterium]
MMKKYYKKFLFTKPNRLHFASHSLHYWPDISEVGHHQAWLDTCEYSDHKWGHFFQNVFPQTQKLIANHLGIKNSQNIAFAPNTHELVFRLLSCFFEQDKIRILTTDCEFYSFDRQVRRIAEWKKAEVIKVPVMPFETFVDRFSEAAQGNFDLIYFSQVFFNNGLALNENDMTKMVDANSKAQICIDGYHAFCALPTSLKNLSKRIYYVAGGYKYAQAGEGLCFMSLPENCQLRPLYTGWFAGMNELSGVKKDLVSYPDDGHRFAGSTFEPTPFYRFNAIWNLFKKDDITIKSIDLHVKNLMKTFVAKVASQKTLLDSAILLNTNEKKRGHFLTYEFSNEEQAIETIAFFEKQSILIDRRGTRIRIGFGAYHDAKDIQLLVDKITINQPISLVS